MKLLTTKTTQMAALEIRAEIEDLIVVSVEDESVSPPTRTFARASPTPPATIPTIPAEEPERNFTVNILSEFELTRAISIISDMVEKSIEGKILGHDIIEDHPIIEAIRLFRARAIPLVVSREIPGTSGYTEYFDIRYMKYDDRILEQTSNFIRQNTIDPSLLAVEDKTAELVAFGIAAAKTIEEFDDISHV